MSDVTVTVDTAPVTIVVSGAQGSPLANSVDFLSFDTTPTGVPTRTGTASWNATEGVLDLQLGDGVTLQIGSAEQVEKCHNNTGSTIAEGKVVYVAGATGLVPKIALASSASDTTSKATLGIVTQTGGIANGAEGWVTLRGKVRGIDTNAFSAGDELWLTTAGNYTNSQPSKATGPNHTVRVGYVVRKAGVGSGIIFVDPLIGEELGDLHDVLISSPTDTQALLYETSTGLWKNASVTGLAVSDASVGGSTEKLLKTTSGGVLTVQGLNVTQGSYSVGVAADSLGGTDGVVNWVITTTGGGTYNTPAASGTLALTGRSDGVPDHFIPPTSDPHIAGALWNNAGTPTISAG